MISFSRLQPEQREAYQAFLQTSAPRGCEYSFPNQYLWGRQYVAFLHGCAAFFSHYHDRSVYPYPIGPGDRRRVLEDIREDARQRGIPCRLTGLTELDRQELELWFPGQFHFCRTRENDDYIYGIDALADLRGKKLQSKRNFVNRFRAEHPDYRVEPLTQENMPLAKELIVHWFDVRRKLDPNQDYLLENLAIARCFNHFEQLQMDGILLMDGDRALAVSVCSRMYPDTVDIHFEKAREDVPGAYAVINCECARYLRLKYPEVRFLNREDDMGLEGLRKAKLSYHPQHMIEKYRACRLEDMYGD